MPAQHPLTLSLQQPDGRHRTLLTRARVRRWVGHAIDRPAQLAVRIVGEDEALALNRDYRGKPYATDVLTFAYEALPELHADVVLCAAVVEQQARASKLGLEAHYAHLIVHGCLHALGMDHVKARDARRMEACETSILAALGYADPWADSEPARPQRVARGGHTRELK
jgi:probable rRNA maturation factor